MQRLITLDSVIYVHENPRRVRRPAPAAELLDEDDRSGQANYSEPSDGWSPEPLQVSAEVGTGAETGEETGEETGAEAEPALELEARQDAESEPEPQPLSEPEPDPEPEPVARFTDNRKTVARSTPMAPPPGYAIEFGTGRLVPIHTFKGRMSYPTGR